MIINLKSETVSEVFDFMFQNSQKYERGEQAIIIRQDLQDCLCWMKKVTFVLESSHGASIPVSIFNCHVENLLLFHQLLI